MYRGSKPRNIALHAVCVMDTIKKAAHAALHKQSAFVPRYTPSRLFLLQKRYNAEALEITLKLLEVFADSL